MQNKVEDSKVFEKSEVSEEELLLVAKGYAMRQLYWPNYIWEIQTKILNKLDDRKEKLVSNGVNVDDFSRQKSDLFNKISASFYHLEKLKENEAAIISIGQEMAMASKKSVQRGVGVVIGTPYEPVDYEYESLLVTLKTTLDLVAIMLAEASGASCDNIVSLLNEVQQASNPVGLKAAILTLLTKETHSKVIQEFKNQNGTKSKRNYSVHQGSLNNAQVNIRFSAGTDISVLKSRAIDLKDLAVQPLMQQQSLEEHSTELFYGVCDLAIESLEILLGDKLPRGSRESVYSSRLATRPRS